MARRKVNDSAETTAETSESAAATAVQEGAEAGSKVANTVIPALGNIVSKSLYSGCYAVSFGVTFTAVAVAKVLPLNNVIGRGLQDGAHDAIERLEKPADAAVEVPAETTAAGATA